MQTALVHEHALQAAQARLTQLENELAETRKSQAPSGSSFLAGALSRSPWNTGAARPASSVPPAGTGYAPQTATASAAPAPHSAVPITAPSAGGGFLHSALTTAAGVAGGALLFDGLRSLLFHSPGPFGPYLGTGWGGGWGQTGGNVYETVVNNYGNANDPGAADAATPQNDGFANDDSLQNASYDPGNADTGNFDNGSDYDSSADFGGNDDMST